MSFWIDLVESSTFLKLIFGQDTIKLGLEKKTYLRQLSTPDLGITNLLSCPLASQMPLPPSITFMIDLFRKELDDFVLVFFDDILIYSQTKEDHEKNLRHNLKTLRRAQLYAKHSKCLFFVEKVAYLGYIVSKDGLTIDLPKIGAVI